MRGLIAAGVGACLASSMAVAEPPPWIPPTNPALPVATVSSMPVSRTVPDPAPDDEPYHRALIGTGITGGLVAATLGLYIYNSAFNQVARPTPSGCVPKIVCTGPRMCGDIHTCYAARPGDDARIDHQHLWRTIDATLGVAALTSAFITAYLWARHHHAPHTILEWSPASGGGKVSVSHSF